VDGALLGVAMEARRTDAPRRGGAEGGGCWLLTGGLRRLLGYASWWVRTGVEAWWDRHQGPVSRLLIAGRCSEAQPSGKRRCRKPALQQVVHLSRRHAPRGSPRPATRGPRPVLALRRRPSRPVGGRRRLRPASGTANAQRHVSQLRSVTDARCELMAQAKAAQAKAAWRCADALLQARVRPRPRLRLSPRQPSYLAICLSATFSPGTLALGGPVQRRRRFVEGTWSGKGGQGC
jgi:hypothetical protein